MARTSKAAEEPVEESEELPQDKQQKAVNAAVAKANAEELPKLGGEHQTPGG